MLKRLRVDNFKSLINVVFEPSRINLLTGRNNSGKTTMCQAINFLRLSVYLPLSEAAAAATGDVWNLTNAYLKRDSISFECECELVIDGNLYTFGYCLMFKAEGKVNPGTFERECSVENEFLWVHGGEFSRETILLENQHGEIRLLHEGKFAQKQDDAYVDTTAPTNITMLSRLYDLQHNTLANAFKRYLGSWQYYDLDPARLRSIEAKQSGVWLNADGSNLSHVLFQLKNYDERRYRSFVQVVQEVEPRLEALNFVPPAQESVFMSLTDSKDNRFSVSSISSGTLRFMAMAYVVIMVGAVCEAANTPPPVVIVEEPENGIYVGHLRRLFELAEHDTEYAPQYMFSSHSPYFIDMFDRHLDGVFVMKSGETHSEIVKPSVERLASVLKEFDLGEAHFRELLA